MPVPKERAEISLRKRADTLAESVGFKVLGVEFKRSKDQTLKFSKLTLDCGKHVFEKTWSHFRKKQTCQKCYNSSIKTDKTRILAKISELNYELLVSLEQCYRNSRSLLPVKCKICFSEGTTSWNSLRENHACHKKGHNGARTREYRFEESKAAVLPFGLELLKLYDEGKEGQRLRKMGTFRCISHPSHIFSTRFQYIKNQRKGCIVCSLTSLNKPERELLEWITEELKLSCETRVRNQVRLKKPVELDIFIPDLGVAIEFNGAYYHSQEHRRAALLHSLRRYPNINVEEKLQEWTKRAQDKSLAGEKKGIRIAQIYEYNWQESKETEKDKIKTFLEGTLSEKFKNLLCSSEVICSLDWNYGPLLSSHGFVSGEILPPSPVFVKKGKVLGKHTYPICEEGDHKYTIYDCGHKIWRKPR